MPGQVTSTVMALLFLAAASAFAQSPIPSVPLDSGRLVRLRLDDQTIVPGRLLRRLAVGDAEVAFCRYPGPPCRSAGASGIRSLAVARIAALEVQRGTRLWRGVVIGAGIGAVLVGAAGWLANGFCDSPRCKVPIPVYVFSGAVSGGLWGALFGSQSVVWGPP